MRYWFQAQRERAPGSREFFYERRKKLMTQEGFSAQRPRMSDLGDELRGFVDAIIPPEEVLRHFRNSRIEFLRGIKAMIDVRIDHLSRKNEPQKGASVTVE